MGELIDRERVDVELRIPTSKFRRPRVGQSVLDRTWLFRRPTQATHALDADADPPGNVVTLVSAPAGYGKTTLMASWARTCAQSGDAVAWVSLDRTDNDRSQFWHAVLRSVQEATRRAAEGSVREEPAFVTAEPLEGQPLVALDELVERSPQPVWLFLDDLQEISAPDVVADLDALLRLRPEDLQLVIASRRDPALALHRLRLSGSLREIRSRELALDRDEVRRMLVQHGVVLDDEGLSLLVERTEGWAAGVRLAALTLSDAPDPGAAVQRFAGDDRAVADYLATEVLARLSEREYRLLQLCALPEQLTPDLAVELTGDPTAVVVLEELSRARLLVAAAQPGSWYRIHTLLRGYLLARLGGADRPAVRAAHTTIARWSAARGQFAWAVEHAVASEDDALAIDVLTTHGPSLLAEGRPRTLHAMVARSSEAVRADPAVRRLDTLAALQTAETAPRRLPSPRRGDHDVVGSTTADPAGQGRLAAVVALQQARFDRHLSAEVLAASASLPDDQEDALALLLVLSRGMVLTLAGRFEEADAELTRAHTLAGASGNPDALLRVSAHRTALAAARGHFRDAWALADETLRVSTATQGSHPHELGGALLLAAHAARQRLDPVAARRLAERAETTSDGALGLEALVSLRSLLTILDIEEGADPLEGCRQLRGWSEMAATHSLSALLVVYLAFVEHRFAWMAGRLDWAREALGRLTAAGVPPGEVATLTATEHLGRGRVDAARHRIAAVLDQSAPCLFPTTVQQAWLIEALLAASTDQRARSHEALRAALGIAEDTGALRVFLDVPGISQLLDEDAGRFGRLEPLVDHIRSSARQRADHEVVPMTPRELVLLTELPAQLTLDDIAARQQVSVNTVKTHVRSIYQKLGASNRREAITEARRRGLL